ncbi:MAG: DNA adenine methylase [Ignavibacteriales bacterium]|nr:DNA adenine methylase [Ignavibacteriales bacterium]
MKYMGSKRLMLQNGLGSLIKEEAPQYGRFVDLFSGASFVAWFAAQNTDKQVVAVDLQKYSKILADSVINRTSSIDIASLEQIWIKKAIAACQKTKLYQEAKSLEGKTLTQERIKELRLLCTKKSNAGPLWNAYGGHYFSPTQSLLFDYLLKYLPSDKTQRTVCLSVVIMTASKCAASPGHTAQPFQPTRTAKKFIREAWNKDPIEILKVELEQIAKKYAQRKGRAIVLDAQRFASQLKETDLVFIDPPYSGVQYSRFYHVLETIARGKVQSEIEGIGRYPSIKERPQSKFSNVGQSREALDNLLEKIAMKKASVILTFPAGSASNGLSGRKVQNISRKWFKVNRRKIFTKFSTLGGNNEIRDARKNRGELILFLTPKKVKPSK